MKQYLDGLQFALDHGNATTDRTGTGTLSVFGMQQRYNLSASFPAVTTKKLAWRAVVSELLWFIEGSGDERRLAEILHNTRDTEKKTIWTSNVESDYWKHKAKGNGDAGRIYGVQWRQWQSPSGYVDQLVKLIDGIKKDPHSRRHIVVAYNPGELDQMALPPCHAMFQMYVSHDNKLSCQMYQRSQDVFLGGPFNIASYALLTHMIAQVCGLAVGEFIHITGDFHVYLNHLDQVKEQLSRDPLPAPQLWLNPAITDITKFTMDDIRLDGYTSHSPIKAAMAV